MDDSASVHIESRCSLVPEHEYVFVISDLRWVSELRSLGRTYDT